MMALAAQSLGIAVALKRLSFLGRSQDGSAAAASDQPVEHIGCGGGPCVDALWLFRGLDTLLYFLENVRFHKWGMAAVHEQHGGTGSAGRAPELSCVGRIGQYIFHGPAFKRIAADGADTQLVQMDGDLAAGHPVQKILIDHGNER